MNTDKKRCSWCQLDKSVSEFGQARRYGAGGFIVDTLRSHCRDCERIRGGDRYKKMRADNPEKIRDGNLFKKYGISQADYNVMFAAQGGKCKVCGCDHTESKVKNGTMLVVDHCHTTGAVRGLLCITCNFLVGTFEAKGPDFFEAVSTYLKTESYTPLPREDGSE